MKNMKKFMALGLAAAMTLSMAACGNDSQGNSGTPGSQDNTGNSGNAGNTGASGDVFGTGDGSIEIGCWWVQYYDSTHYKGGDMTVNPDWVTAQAKDDDDEDTAKQKEINRNVA